MVEWAVYRLHWSGALVPTLMTSGAMYSNVPTELIWLLADWNESRTRDRPKSVIWTTHAGPQCAPQKSSRQESLPSRMPAYLTASRTLRMP